MQSHWESLIEQTFNVGSGFFVALLAWEYIVGPLYDNGTIGTVGITFIFTIISVARGYLWRRYFNFRAWVRGARGSAVPNTE